MLGDDVAYSIHDAEDFYRAGLIPMELLVNGSTEIERVIQRVADQGRYAESELALAWDSAAPFAIEHRYLAARGAMPHAASLGLFGEGSVAETCSTPGTAAFRRLALDENSCARRRDALHHGLLGTAHQRAALREWTSNMIQRYVQAVRLGTDATFDVPQNIQMEIDLLKGLTWEYVIESPMLATQQMGHRKIVRGLFEIYLDASSNHVSVLPPRFRDYLAVDGDTAYQIYGELDPPQRRVRMVADIIANMTDLEALRMYQRLHGFLPGSLSDGSPM